MTTTAAAARTIKYTLHPEAFGLRRAPYPTPQQTIHLRQEAHVATAYGLMLLAQRRGTEQSDLPRLEGALAERPELHYLIDAARAWVEQQPASAAVSEQWGERWALANAMQAAQDAADPIVREPLYVDESTGCRHGVAWADDCAACEE